jgi:WD40 repeat-containing protein SMU1
MKWQAYTGQIPMVRRAYHDTRDDDNNSNSNTTNNEVDPKRRKTRKEFDLVLGEVTVHDTIVHGHAVGTSKGEKHISGMDYATIKFGKNAYAEVMSFLPDGSGIVTGSSDGLIEIWDNDGRLRTKDFIYQAKDELMGHDSGAAITALAVSNDTTLIASGAVDGMVLVWRLDTGKCLRTIPTTADSSNSNSPSITNGVACICFAPDSSHILIGNNDGICREFGLRTARMLKEFRGHTSYITACYYHLQQQPSTSYSNDNNEAVRLLVITASGDGTARIWDGKTMDTISVLRPVSLGLRNMLTQVNTSIATIDIEQLNQTASNEGSPTIHTILKLHTPINTMIIVPRGPRAFMVDFSGRVIRIFEDSSTNKRQHEESCFVAATVNSTNRWLYIVRDDDQCCIFDVRNGTLESTISDFAPRCISSSSSATAATPTTTVLKAEISGMAHHPTNNLLAAFSNHKGQKRGKIVLWK